MPDAAPAPAAAAQPEEHCPVCGALRLAPDVAFCEICGYNFATGSGPAAPVPAEPAAPASAVEPVAASAATQPAMATAATTAVATATAVRHWFAVVSVAAAPHGPGSPPPPAGFAPVTVLLTAKTSILGRRSAARALYPELDFSHDTAVSHRHALLQLGDDGRLFLRDIGSSNGTVLNGQPVPPLVDTPLAPGDVLTLGHWSRVTLGTGEEQP